MTPEIGFRDDQEFCFTVVDNFLANPLEMRDYALGLDFVGDVRFFKGKRSVEKCLSEPLKVEFERIIGRTITKWDYPSNGCFQFCTPQDRIVYHMDSQQYAAIIYLTPDAPIECGTSFYKSKNTNFRKFPTFGDPKAVSDILALTFLGGFYDKSHFELVDTVGNVFNRLVIWDAKMIHAASQYFGQTKDDARLFQVFFFDAQ